LDLGALPSHFTPLRLPSLLGHSFRYTHSDTATAQRQADGNILDLQLALIIMSSTSVSIHAPSPSARAHRRRQSTPNAGRPKRQEVICQPLPYSLEALDLRTGSPVNTLASLRIIVLSYLEHLEECLSHIETPALESWREKGGHTVDDASQWAQTALEMLVSIREDVCSHLPELSVDTLRAHLPDLPDVPTIDDMRSHLPELPHMPDVRSRLADVRAHLPDIGLALEDVKGRLHDLDLTFVPVLSAHLDNLQSHLQSMDFPAGAEHSYNTLSSVLSDLMDALSPPADIGRSTFEGAELMLEKAASDITRAVKRSFEGVRLISYADLPPAWQNNPFVTSGYRYSVFCVSHAKQCLTITCRFIPLERWPLILMSLFALHNETRALLFNPRSAPGFNIVGHLVNIHTHLVPFVLWTLNSIPYINPNALEDTPETLFMIFALACLLCSTIWHTMAGCAHSGSMEFCARVDYVGIGW